MWQLEFQATYPNQTKPLTHGCDSVFVCALGQSNQRLCMDFPQERICVPCEATHELIKSKHVLSNQSKPCLSDHGYTYNLEKIEKNNTLVELMI